MATSTVTLPYGCGSIRGLAQPAVPKLHPRALHLFLNIPYAQAKRFQPSTLLPLPPDGRVIDASSLDDRPAAPSLSSPDAAESPLALALIRPAAPLASSSDRPGWPVVVFFHGGAFNVGSPLDRALGSFAAWAPQPLLVVAVAYRLGPLGFLAGEAAEAPPNLGLGDQRVALAWVKERVAAFGGDVGNVTLMGESAGAHSIGHLMLSPKAPPLPVRKAILESGAPTARSVLSASHPRHAQQLASFRGFVRNAPLATLPSSRLMRAAALTWQENQHSVRWPFQPVVDGPDGFIPDVSVRLWEGHARRRNQQGDEVALLAGFCSHEGASFVPSQASTNEDFLAFFRNLIPALTPADLSALEALYPDPVTDASSPYRNPPGSREGAQHTRLVEAYGHYAYICPVLHTATLLSRASLSSPVYVYEYAASGPLTRGQTPHGSQAPAVDHDPTILELPGLHAVADAMAARWGAFAASPGGKLAPDLWPRFDAGTGGDDPGPAELLVFGQGNDEAAGGEAEGVPVRSRRLTDRERRQCAYWWPRMELSQGMGVKL